VLAVNWQQFRNTAIIKLSEVKPVVNSINYKEDSINYKEDSNSFISTRRNINSKSTFPLPVDGRITPSEGRGQTKLKKKPVVGLNLLIAHRSEGAIKI